MGATNMGIWKNIDGLVNYEVSSFGRLRNAATERILKPNITSTVGYSNVSLCKNGEVKTHKIHKLVAMEFITKPETKHGLTISSETRETTAYLIYAGLAAAKTLCIGPKGLTRQAFTKAWVFTNDVIN